MLSRRIFFFNLPNGIKHYTTPTWVRPLLQREVMAENAQRCEGRAICAQIYRFRSVRKITKTDCEKVFENLSRRIKPLRLAIDEKDQQLWFKQMEDKPIDIEVVENADIEEEHSCLIHKSFDSSSGPLWAVRLLPWHPKHAEYIESVDKDRGVGTETDDERTCHIIFSFHHAIVDGNSLKIFFKELLIIFNNILSEGKCDESCREISLIDGKEYEEIYAEVVDTFENNTKYLIDRQSYAKKFLDTPKFLSIEEAKPTIITTRRTEFVRKNLNEESSKLFISACKKNKVTVNSGLGTALNCAIIRFMKESGVQDDFFRITSKHTLDERTYYKDSNPFKNFGMAYQDIFLSSDLPYNVEDQFWDEATKFEKSLKTELKRKPAIETAIMSDHFKLDGVELQNRKIMYTMTNFLDITKYSETEGDLVQLDWYSPVMTNHNSSYVWMSVFLTFRGKLIHNMMYDNARLSEKAAHRIHEEVFNIIKQVS